MSTAELDNLSRVEPAAAQLPGVLPWEWFDFDRPAQVLRPGTEIPDVDHRGARHAWQIDVGGRPIPFKIFRRGTGRPTLLMLHGMGLTIASFRGVAGPLFATHDLVLPDYWGCTLPGPAGAGDGGPKSFVRAVFRIADALGLATFSLAGHSLGGGLSLMAALEEPARIERLLLANPACFPQVLPRMYRMVRVPLLGELIMAVSGPERFVGGLEYIGYVDKRRFDPELRGRYVRMLSDRANRLRLMGIIRHLPAGERDLTLAWHVPRLGEIRQPVLLSWGARDLLLVEGAGERLAAALPRVELDWHQDLAHIPHEEAPERLGPRWAAFLNS